MSGHLFSKVAVTRPCQWMVKSIYHIVEDSPWKNKIQQHAHFRNVHFTCLHWKFQHFYWMDALQPTGNTDSVSTIPVRWWRDWENLGHNHVVLILTSPWWPCLPKNLRVTASQVLQLLLPNLQLESPNWFFSPLTLFSLNSYLLRPWYRQSHMPHWQ